MTTRRKKQGPRTLRRLCDAVRRGHASSRPVRMFRRRAAQPAVAVVDDCCIGCMKDVYGVGLADRIAKEPLDA
jgi:hypothetical protein